jgi:hypothetical protein
MQVSTFSPNARASNCSSTIILIKTHFDFLILGSNVIVAGTAIFGAENAEQAIATLKSAVNTAQAKFAARGAIGTSGKSID